MLVSSTRHDVETAAQRGLAQADDAELLRVAHEQSRIFVTRDRDFGALVFVQGRGPGIVYLRILPLIYSAAIWQAGPMNREAT